MSLAQITVWFTNARVKMRKENKLPLNLYAKKKKKKNLDESFPLDETLSPPNCSHNLSFNGKIHLFDRSIRCRTLLELSTSFDTEYISDGHIDESNYLNEKAIVIAYSCLTFEQVVSPTL